MATKKQAPLFDEDAATPTAIAEADVAVILSVFRSTDPYTLGGSMFDAYPAKNHKSISGFYDMSCEIADTDVADAGGEENCDLFWVVWVCRDTAILDVDINRIHIVGGDKEWKAAVKKALVSKTKCFLQVESGKQPSWNTDDSDSDDAEQAAPAKKAPAKRGPVKKAAAAAPAAKESTTTSTAAKKTVAKRAASAAKAAPAAKKAAKPSPTVSKAALAKKRAEAANAAS